VKYGDDAVLVDAGISASRILRELERARTPGEAVRAVFVTHEHSDHVTGLRVTLKKLPHADVYASAGTLDALESREYGQARSFRDEISMERKRTISPEQAATCGGLVVRAFRTLHDAAEPFGYTIEGGGKRVAIITDTGVVTEEIHYHALDADILVLEANHDTEILLSGPYPEILKARILSERGHLSNAQAANALCRALAENGKKRVALLAHLSQENNTPRIAERTVCTILAQNGWFTGSGLYVGVLPRGQASMVFRF